MLGTGRTTRADFVRRRSVFLRVYVRALIGVGFARQSLQFKERYSYSKWTYCHYCNGAVACGCPSKVDPYEIRGAALDWNDSRRNLFRDTEVPPDFLNVARMLEQRLRTALSEAFVLFYRSYSSIEKCHLRPSRRHTCLRAPRTAWRSGWDDIY